jgi:hypothetical protein
MLGLIVSGNRKGLVGIIFLLLLFLAGDALLRYRSLRIDRRTFPSVTKLSHAKSRGSI